MQWSETLFMNETMDHWVRGGGRTFACSALKGLFLLPSPGDDGSDGLRALKLGQGCGMCFGVAVA